MGARATQWIMRTFLEPNLQVEGHNVVPGCPENRQRNRRVHPAAQKDGHARLTHACGRGVRQHLLRQYPRW